MKVRVNIQNLIQKVLSMCPHVYSLKMIDRAALLVLKQLVKWYHLDKHIDTDGQADGPNVWAHNVKPISHFLLVGRKRGVYKCLPGFVSEWLSDEWMCSSVK